jgi:magnesium chelatase subunit D
VLQTLDRYHGDAAPLLVLLTDGKANVGLDAGDPWQASLGMAGLLAARGVSALVVDTESGYLRLGRAGLLAEALGAECLTLEQLSSEQLTLTIRSRLPA